MVSTGFRDRQSQLPLKAFRPMRHCLSPRCAYAKETPHRRPPVHPCSQHSYCDLSPLSSLVTWWGHTALWAVECSDSPSVHISPSQKGLFHLPPAAASLPSLSALVFCPSIHYSLTMGLSPSDRLLSDFPLECQLHKGKCHT